MAMAMAPPRSGAPPTDTFDPMNEAGAKRQRPDRANEAQTQVRSRPRARPHKACWPGCATILAAMALWLGLGLGLASESAKGDVSAAKAPSGAAAPLLNTSASAVNHLPPHPRWPNICTNTHTAHFAARRYISHPWTYTTLPRQNGNNCPYNHGNTGSAASSNDPQDKYVPFHPPRLRKRRKPPKIKYHRQFKFDSTLGFPLASQVKAQSR
jgi:hypothetical protein